MVVKVYLVDYPENIITKIFKISYDACDPGNSTKNLSTSLSPTCDYAVIEEQKNVVVS